MAVFSSHFDDREEIVAGDATRLRELLHPDRDAVTTGYSLAQASLAPGASSLPHRLAQSELYYVISGQGLITIDGEAYPLTPGGVVLVPANATQHVDNPGPDDLVFLCLVEPPWMAESEEVDAGA